MWPPISRIGAEDDLFPQGWGGVADEVVAGSVSIEALLEKLSSGERADAEALIAGQSQDLSVLATAMTKEAAPAPSIPDFVSATSFVRLEKGEIDPWDLVRPLPDRPTTKRRIGTEVHRLIEERSRGISTYPNETELDEPSEMTEPGLIEEALAKWAELGYGDRDLATLPSGEPMTELPFALKMDGRVIRGRIDAVYKTDDDGLEIVDFKTGRSFEVSDQADQLDVYARALKANGLIREGQRVVLTYAFLGGDPPLTREWQES
jgi:hypothetical protein